MNLRLSSLLGLGLGLVLVFAPGLALGQSTPNWSRGYVPPPSEWNALWAGKQDLNALQGYLANGQTAAQLKAGTINATPVLSAKAAAGDTSLLPCGHYRLDSSLSIGTGNGSIEGVYQGCVFLDVNFPAGDVITFNTPNVIRPRVANLTINALAQRTSGAALHFSGTYDARAYGLTFTGLHGGDAILVDNGASTTSIEQIDCRPPTATVTAGLYGAGGCIHADGDFVEIFAKNIVSYAWTYGLNLGYGSGIIVQNTDFLLGMYGVNAAPQAGQILWALNFTDVRTDTNIYDNMHFAGAGFITDVQINNTWISNSQLGVGIALGNPNINGFQMSNSHVLFNQQHGMLITQGKNIILTGNSFCSNSRDASSHSSGLAVGSTAASQLDVLLISGNQFGACGIAVARGGAATQDKGLFIGAVSGVQSDPEYRQITVVNNQAFGNLTSGFTLTTGSKTAAAGNTQ